MKNNLDSVLLYAGVCLVGVLVGLCGVGLSLGFHSLSLVGFFGAILLLVVLHLAGRRRTAERNREKEQF